MSVFQPPRQLAIVRSYRQLLGVLRARADEIGVTRERIDKTAGLQSGYSGKLLSMEPVKSFGRTSLGPMLGTLGLALIVVEDCASMEELREQIEARGNAAP